MEKAPKNIKGVENNLCKTYICFQELETPNILNFISYDNQKIIFKGINQQQTRKSKQFIFDGISLLTDKFRHSYEQIARQIAQGLLTGKNKSALITGIDEHKKQKIMIGQSQNPALLLLVIAQLFDICYQRELEDKITIKLSCWDYRDGSFSDVIGVSKQNWVVQDLIERRHLVGVPQIIIRNMKSALKIIRILMKNIEQIRQQKEDSTQNIIFTLKLQIDNEYDKQGNVSKYLLSKFHLAKLANPFLHKSQNKQAQWFISLFNSLQAETLNKSHKIQKIQEIINQDTDFCHYIRQVLIKSANEVYCFNCISNKMNSNECLTIFKFNAYLQQIALNPIEMIIDLRQLKQQQIILQNEMSKIKTEEISHSTHVNWIKQHQQNNLKDLLQVLELNQQVMNRHNYLQYQYANVLTTACDKLQKYIFSEQIQDYYYAKKIQVQITNSIKQQIINYFTTKRKLNHLQQSILQNIDKMIITMKNGRENVQSKEWRFLLNSKAKQKQVLEKLFNLYNTLTLHFLYEESEITSSIRITLEQASQIREQQQQLPDNFNYTHYSFHLADTEKTRVKEAVKAPAAAKQRVEKRRNKQVDEVELMFKNRNANLCVHRLKH